MSNLYNSGPAVSIFDFVEHSEIDLALATKRGKRPTTAVIASTSGCGKSSIIEDVLPTHLEKRLHLERNEPFDGAGLDPKLQGNHVHWSANRSVCLITELSSSRDLQDVRGIPLPQEDGSTWNTMPDIVTMERAAYAAGARHVIIFYDECFSVDQSMMKALNDVFLNGRYGTHSLRDTTWVIGATNRTKDANAGVVRTLSILQNRVNYLEVRMPLSKYVDYAREIELPPAAIAFAKAFPDDAFPAVTAKEGPFSTHRSFTEAMLWVGSYNESRGNDSMMLPLEEEYVYSKVAGFIGDTVTLKLKAFADNFDKLPTPEEILKNPKKAKCPAISDIGASYAAAEICIAMAKPENLPQCWTYVQRLHREVQVISARELQRASKGDLRHTNLMQEWLKDPKNLSLIRDTYAKFD